MAARAGACGAPGGRSRGLRPAGSRRAVRVPPVLAAVREFGCIPARSGRDPAADSDAYAEVGCIFVSPDATGDSRLAITDLKVSFGERRVVDIAGLALADAEIVGLAGGSGSGKSMTPLAVIGPAPTTGAPATARPRRAGGALP